MNNEALVLKLAAENAALLKENHRLLRENERLRAHLQHQVKREESALDKARVSRDRVTFLEQTLHMVERVPAVSLPWELTVSEGCLFNLLMARQLATRDAMMAALYADRVEQPDPKILDVFMTKIRHKLKEAGFNVVLRSSHGRGYYFDPSDKRAINDELKRVADHEPVIAEVLTRETS